MKAREVMEHFREVGKWVNWKKTCDQFLHGDPDMEVKGIATAWISTNAALREAAACGLNLFITHEPAFCGGYEGTVSGDKVDEAGYRGWRHRDAGLSRRAKRTALGRIGVHGVARCRCQQRQDRRAGQQASPQSGSSCTDIARGIVLHRNVAHRDLR